MKTWKVVSEGESWTVDAPDDVTEAEVNEFAAANYASWVNGGRYRMDPVGAPAPVESPAAPAEPPPPGKADYDRAVAMLDQQIDALKQEKFSRGDRGPLYGGGRPRAPAAPELDKQIAELTALRDKFAIGSTGEIVGGIGGALAGGGAGAAIGSFAGPPGMVVGGAIGAILGGAGGVAAGTHLWDIPEARETREVTDQEAAELIKARAIESLIWDGAFVLILGPGGRAIGKMTKGARFLPALKAAAKESFAWDALPKVKEQQLADVISKRADAVPPGAATSVSRALGTPTLQTTPEAAESLLTDIAARSGGRIPTEGELKGVVSGKERFIRSHAPNIFFENERSLSDTAEEIRRTALSALDNAGALTGPEFGETLAQVTKSANESLKRTTAPIFERAAQLDVQVDMTPTMRYLDAILAKDAAAIKPLLTPSERISLEQIRDRSQAPVQYGLRGLSRITPEAVQDGISSMKAALRGASGDGTQPGEYMAKVLRGLVDVADNSYSAMLMNVDPVLRRDLTQARQLYRETLQDLYSDAMATAASRNPEDIGRALTSKGTVTEIRELRAALDRAVSVAPAKARYKGGVKPENLVEMSAADVKAARAKIDAGLIKGFIEKNTMSLDSLEQKLKDPDFRLTLKELLTGKGVADPALGQKVLDELDRTAAVVKLIRPELAPMAGRLAVPGMGGVGGGTAAAAITGGNGQGAVPLFLFTITGVNRVSKIIADAMTSGNLGTLRALQRYLALSRIAGKNAAAAEAARQAMEQIEGGPQ